MEKDINHQSQEEKIKTDRKLLGDDSMIAKLSRNQSKTKPSSDDSQSFPVRVVCISDVGQVRENNEDSYRFGTHDGIFIVADGMGGHQSGEVASKAVVDLFPLILKDTISKATELPLRYRSIINSSVNELNHQIYEQACKDPELRGMGSTLAMVWLVDDAGTVLLANVGDSRIYYFRKGNLNQLSVDHSVVGLLVLQGEITSEEARFHPARGKLYRYIGMEGDVTPEIHDLHLQPDDILLLCSDGISDHLSDYRIQLILNDFPDLKKANRELIDAAKKQGGKDNLTAMLLQWAAKV